MNENESWDEYNQRLRVEQERWRQAEEQLRGPPKEKEPPSFYVRPEDRITFPVEDRSTWGGGYQPGQTLADNPGCLPIFVLIPSIAVWPVLYVGSVAVGFLAAGLCYGMLEAGFDVYREGPKLAIGIGAGFVGVIVTLIANRFDHRFAGSFLWRWPRHLIRLVVIAAIAHVFLATEVFHRSGNDSIPGRDLLTVPWYLAILGAIVAAAHVVLTRDRLRAWWHRKLEAAWLRPKDESDPV